MSEDFNITDLFFAAVQRCPQRTAIIDKSSEISFEDFALQVNATAAWFQKKGIEKGDLVLVFVPMSVDLYRIVLALFSIGATAVFLDEWVSKKRMEECCRVAKCKAIVGGLKVRLLSLFSAELRRIPIKLGRGTPSILHANCARPRVQFSDTALITFTTGSTGTPKAAKRTHGFLLEQFAALNEKLQLKPNDINMPMLPIVLLINLGNGNTSVIADFNASKPDMLQPAKIIRQLSEHRVTSIIASPFIIKQLSKHMLEKNIRLPLVEKIFTGGAPVFPAEAELYTRAFPQAKADIVYGSTEAEPISSINAAELVKEKQNLLSGGLNVGLPYRKTEVKIIRITEKNILAENESELDLCATGSIGEIIVSGPHVLSEYFNNEEALKRNKIFTGGKCWHRTGDSGYLAEDGTLFLTGRCSTLIRHDGELLSPFIYENYFQTLDGVSLGTILKKKDQLTAVIEMSNGKSKEAVKQEILGSGIRLEEVIFLEKIPRDPRHNSKIDYALLAKLLD